MSGAGPDGTAGLRPGVEALPDGLYELRIEAAGFLPLPAALVAALDLRPGDVLSLVPEAGSLHVEAYRELFSDAWEAVSAPLRLGFVSEFLRRPLTYLEQGGAVPVSPELFALAAGDRVHLRVMSHGFQHQLYLFRDEEPSGAA